MELSNSPETFGTTEEPILDFIQSEKEYLDRLDDLHSRCISDLLVDCRNKRPSILPISDFNVELSVLFNDFEDILDLTKKIYKDLTTLIKDTSCIKQTDKERVWHLFFKFLPLMKVYGAFNAKFIADHPLLKYLESLFKNNNKFSAYLNSKFGQSENALEAFMSCLRLPVERTNYYFQFVLGVPPLASLSELDTDVKDLKEYLEACEENEKRHLKIQSLEREWGGHVFYNEKRTFIKEGPMIKASRRKDVEYQFLLFNDILVYGKRIATGSISHHRTLQLRYVNIGSDNAKNECEFFITSNEKSFAVKTKSENERNEWVSVLENTISEYKVLKEIEKQERKQIEDSGIKTRKIMKKSTSSVGSQRFNFLLSKGSSSILESDSEENDDKESEDKGFAPVWMQDQTSDECMGCSSPFTLFNRRHHCRRCGKVYCGKCSSYFVAANKVIRSQLSNTEVRVCKPCFAIVKANDNNIEEDSKGSLRSLSSKFRLSKDISLGLKTGELTINQKETDFNNPLGHSEDNSRNSNDKKRSSNSKVRTVKKKAAVVYANNKSRIQEVLEKIKGSDQESKSVRQLIVEEILVTEERFVYCLVVMLEIYIEPLLENAKLKDKTYGKICEKQSPDKVTSMDVFFRSVEKIFTLNMELLCDLTERVADWKETSCIGDIFKLYGSLFTIYDQYSDAQEFACRTIFECTQNETEVPGFADFLSQIDFEPGFDLNSLLIKPIQRVPRYQLLLEEYLKKTKKSDVSHPDIPLVEEALQDVVTSANRINETIRSREHLQKLMECQARWIGNSRYNFVASGRFLLKEGPLRKQCKRALKEFYFILTSDALVYGNSIGENTGVKDFYKYHRHFKLNSFQVVECQGKAEFLQITGKDKTFIAGASSQDERDEWIKAIKEAKENYKKIILHTDKEEDEKYAPLWIPDAATENCSVCEEKFNAFSKRRHHCRYCGKLVCDNCSPHYVILKNIDASNGSRVCKNCMANEQDVKNARKITRGSVWQTLKRGTIFGSIEVPTKFNEVSEEGGLNDEDIQPEGRESRNPQDEDSDMDSEEEDEALTLADKAALNQKKKIRASLKMNKLDISVVEN